MITIRMPKELLAKWLAALRSGEYKQSRESLYDGNGYCCLGVLQKIHVGRTWVNHMGDELPSKR